MAAHERPADDRPPLRAVEDPPQDVDAEQAVLGAVLRAAMDSNDAAVRLLPDLPAPGDFYRPAHEEIAKQLLYNARTGLPLDAISIAATLADTGGLARVGGAPYLHTLTSRGATPESVAFLAQRIGERARLRRAQASVNRAQQRLVHADPDDVSVFYEAMADLEEAAQQTAGGPSRAIDYVSFTGLFSKPRQPVRWLANPIIAAGRISLLYSPGKTGKSLIAMESAAALATGRAVLSSEPTGELHHVLYVDQEMTEEDWIDRLAEMGYGPADEAMLGQYLHLAQLQAWPPMDTREGARALLAEVEHTRASVVIIDTASKVIAGEENANDTQQAFYRNSIVPLKRAGVAVLILDHTGKDLDRGARGGSAKTDNVDLAFEYVLRAKDRLTLRCTHKRFRDSALDDPIYLRRVEDPLTHVIEDASVALSSATGAPGIRPTYLMERVSKLVEASPGANRKTIETARLGKTDYVRRAIDCLVAEGFMRTEAGPRGSVLHYVEQPFRED